MYRQRHTVSIADPGQALFWPVTSLGLEVPDEAGSDMVKFVEWACRRAFVRLVSKGIGISEASLCAPIVRTPHNILCVGRNYDAHPRESSRSGFDRGGARVPEKPIGSRSYLRCSQLSEASETEFASSQVGKRGTRGKN